MVRSVNGLCSPLNEDEILLRLQQKEMLKRPTPRNQNSLYNLIDTSESLLESESHWIRRSDDLVALAGDADYGWFNAALEKVFITFSKTLTLVSMTHMLSTSKRQKSACPPSE